jgi:hypothetical protein
MLTRALARTTNPYRSQWLAQRLAAVAARLGPKEAARAAATLAQARAAATLALAQALAKTTEPLSLGGVAEVLAARAAELEPKEAARSCAPAAAILTQALARTTSRYVLPRLAQGLVALAARLEPKEAAATLFLALAKMTDRGSAEALAAERGQYTSRFDSPEPAEVLARGLAVILTPVEPRELSGRAAAVVAAVGGPAGSGHAVGTPALLRPALAPLPCPFATPELVELLKYPTCVGPARRMILDQLGQRYRRRFADHWAFVRFAQQQKLDLDFTSPPQRPVLPATGEKK